MGIINTSNGEIVLVDKVPFTPGWRVKEKKPDYGDQDPYTVWFTVFCPFVYQIGQIGYGGYYEFSKHLTPYDGSVIGTNVNNHRITGGLYDWTFIPSIKTLADESPNRVWLDAMLDGMGRPLYPIVGYGYTIQLELATSTSLAEWIVVSRRNMSNNNDCGPDPLQAIEFTLEQTSLQYIRWGRVRLSIVSYCSRQPPGFTGLRIGRYGSNDALALLQNEPGIIP